MLNEMKEEYINGRYQKVTKRLQDISSNLSFVPLPRELGDYKRYISTLKNLSEDVIKVSLFYNIVELKTALTTHYENQIRQQEQRIEALNKKYSELIQRKIQELELEAKQKNDLIKIELEEKNAIYLNLEDKRKQLEEYSETIIDMCSLYGVTSSDITISSETFSTDELDKLYDQYIEYMQQPKNRTNVISQFREKFPNLQIQGAFLLGFLCLMFTPVLDILSVAGILMLILEQRKAKNRVQLYALLLGLVYNINPLSLQSKENIEDKLVNEKVDRESDPRIIPIITEWKREKKKLEEEETTKKQQEALQELINKASSYEAEFKVKIGEFEKNKLILKKKITEKIEAAEKSFEEAKSKVKLLGQAINPSAVFDTKYRLGLRDEVIEEVIDIGLMNIIIRPCKSEERQKEFLQVLLANALCNVKAGNLVVYIYDPNKFGQDLVSFYHSALEETLIFKQDKLDEIITLLKNYAMNNMKDMQGKNINQYNKEAEQLGKVEKDYKLLIILSQPKTIEENEALTNFMAYSAKMGVFVWLVSNKSLPDTYIFEVPFGEIEHPYTVDVTNFGTKVAKTFLEAKEKNSIKTLLWEDYRDIAVPDDKMWSYCADEFLDIDPGLENGDPSKPEGYTIGNTGDIHALAAGRTGAGKSVFLNAIIATLCQKYSPRDLELWLIDYKCLEFGFFLPKPGQDFTFPHIRACLCTTDGDYAESVYTALSKECEERFRIFEGAGTKNLKEYNEKMVQMGTPEKRLPRILFINDEFQVIFEKAKDKVLDSIQKSLTNVAKLGRAAGCHLFFTSQSMNKTVSSDVLAQFSLRFALKCDESVSVSLIGTKKASEMKETRGYCYVKSSRDNSLEAQKKYKIPFLKNNILLNHMQKLWKAAETQKIPRHDLISYNEKVEHSIEELKEFYKNLNINNPNTPKTGLIILGNRMTYSIENKAPENIIIIPENNSHIVSVFSETVDLVDFYKEILCNLDCFKEKPGVFINSQVEAYHYVCEVEKRMKGEMLELSNTKTSIFKLFEMFYGIYLSRVKANKKDDPVYFILIGWEKAVGFGIDRDPQYTVDFSMLLKQCGEYNMHFILICSEVEGISLNIINSCKFRVCGKCDEKSSYALLDTKQGCQPSEKKKGYLYLKTGNELPTRAKLYISPKTREIKKSTFVM